MSLPDLGVGIIHLAGLEPVLEAGQQLLDVVEIEPQTSWYRSGSGYRQHEHLLSAVERLPQPTLVHGVGFPVGGTIPPDPAAVRPFADTVARLAAPWCSEHLSFNRVADGDREYGTLFLLPPVQSEASVGVAAANIAGVQALLPAPFAFETGVNYLRPQAGEMTDGAFFAAVAEAADCGILLDLHNLWCNERNGRQPVLEVLAELPLDRIWEVHLAGGEELDRYWLDAHSGTVPDELMRLAAEIVPALPALHALIFEMVPDHLTAGRVTVAQLVGQLERLRELWDSRRTPTRLPAPDPRAPAPPGASPADPREWEATLGRAVLTRAAPTSDRRSLAASLAADPGVEIIRQVVDQARAGMVTAGLPRTVRLILLSAGEVRLRELLADFWSGTSPEQFAGQESAAFGRHLLDHGGDIPHLPDTVALELALLRAQEDGEAQEVLLGGDPHQLLSALGSGVLPSAVTPGRFLVTVPAP